MTLNWYPFLRLKNCDSGKAGNNESLKDCRKFKGYYFLENKNCEAEGLLSRMWNIMGQKYNFTTLYDKEPTGVWGVAPVVGTYEDDNATFVGAIGLITNLHEAILQI